MNQNADLRKARRLVWMTIAYLCTSVTLLFVVMSGSQALKSEFVSDALSIIPAILFLIGDRIEKREPNPLYPFGYERAVSAAYLGAALALLAVGLFLFFDGSMKLVMKEHPTVGGFRILGRTVWTGWLALAVLVSSAIPPLLLGRAKRQVAERLHDKTLAVDADASAADWQSATAAMIGVLGIAFGIWWLDAVAGVLISLEIIRSGWSELRAALGDIMDRRPQQLESKEEDPITRELTHFLRRKPWVEDVVVRVRERGRQFMADAHVVPRGEEVRVDDIAAAREQACGLDKRLASVTIAPVPKIPDEVEKARSA